MRSITMFRLSSIRVCEKEPSRKVRAHDTMHELTTAVKLAKNLHVGKRDSVGLFHLTQVHTLEAKKRATYATMKYNKPSLKIRLPTRDPPVERNRSLYPVKHSTIKSKHIAKMSAEVTSFSLMLVKTHPTCGSQ